MKAVLVGCGAMSEGWLNAVTRTPLLAGKVEIAGFVDLDEGLARRRAEQFGMTDAAIGTDLGTVLADVRPDALFDVVTPNARAGVVRTGLGAGCHVLSEKPMATSLAEARDLIARASAANRIHAIVQNRRFISGMRRIRRLIDTGALGELTALHADFFIGAHFGGFRDQMDNPLLLDMAIHTIDAARFLSGGTPQAVYCLEANPKGSWYRGAAAANAIFELSDGVVFTYRGSWAAEGGTTSWESRWRIVGTRGTLVWDGEDAFDAQVVAGDTGFLRPLEPIAVPDAPNADDTHGHASVIAEFLSAIAEGRQPETDGRDNINSLAMVLGAIESARTGRRVTIETGISN